MSRDDQVTSSEPIDIPSSLDNERIDRVLSILLARSRKAVAQLIEDGVIYLNGVAVCDRDRRVQKGEILEVKNGALVLDEGLRPASRDVVSFDVIYEDSSIVVVDKPAGLVVHPGAGHAHDTLASGLVARYPDLVAASASGAGEPMRPGIVHRLDKDTSGLMVIARTPAAYKQLVNQLATREMGRTYETLVVGHISSNEGVIEAPIGRSRRRPTQMAITSAGREARTRYRVMRRFEHPIVTSLLEVNLETGRTHQIRVHFSAIGHPVAGDKRYGGAARDLLLNRPFLHAKELRFRHPESGEERTFISSLPEDLRAVLARLS